MPRNEETILNPIIELVRGVAAWMVFTAHAAHLLTPDPAFLKFLWTGVDLFFVISGFVFAPMLLSTRFPILPYAIRRVFRIYPLYFVSLLIYYVATPGAADKLVYFVKHLFFLGTTSDVKEAFFFNPAYWSLPVEVEYYLLLPLLAILVAGRLRIVLAIFGAFLVVRFLIVLGATPFSAPNPNWLSILRVHLPGILIEFLIGVFVYVAYQRTSREGHVAWSILAGLCGLILWLTLGLFFARYGDAGINAHIWLKSYFSVLCAVAYGLILFGLLRLIRCESLPCSRAAMFLGSISYGVYLWHTLVLRLYQQSAVALPGYLAFSLCAMFVLVFALVGYRLVEQPARSYGRRLALRHDPARQAQGSGGLKRAGSGNPLSLRDIRSWPDNVAFRSNSNSATVAGAMSVRSSRLLVVRSAPPNTTAWCKIINLIASFHRSLQRASDRLHGARA